MPERSMRKILGWFFIGVGVWSVISAFSDRWLHLNQGFEIMATGYFYKQYVNMKSFPEFFPLTVILAIFSVLTGVGFLREKSWAKIFGFLYIFLAAAGASILCYKYLQKFKENWIWVCWFVGITFLGILAYFIKWSEAKTSFKGSLLSAYEQIHWKFINLVARIFGIASIVVGGIIGLWGVNLLFQSHAVSYPSDIPTDLISKLIIIFFSLFFVIIGILCLLAKPIVPKDYEK